MHFEGQTGTIHLEGLLIQGPDPLDLTEGILFQNCNDINMQNCRIEGVHARDQTNFVDNHPDCFQPLGIGTLRMDRCYFSADGHRSYMATADGSIDAIWEKRILMEQVSPVINNNVALWHRNQGGGTWPHRVEDVYYTRQVVSGTTKSTSATLTNNGHTINISGGIASWPTDTNFKAFDGTTAGQMRETAVHTPPSTLVPSASEIGVDYVSPGYL